MVKEALELQQNIWQTRDYLGGERDEYMEKDVLERITQALTEGRIIEKLHQSEEYHKAKEEETRTYDLLTSDLTDHQKQRLDDYIDSATWTATIWERTASHTRCPQPVPLSEDTIQRRKEEIMG